MSGPASDANRQATPSRSSFVSAVWIAVLGALSTTQVLAEKLQDGVVRRVVGIGAVLVDLLWAEIVLGLAFVVMYRLVRSRSRDLSFNPWSLDDLFVALRMSKEAKVLAGVTVVSGMAMFYNGAFLAHAKVRAMRDVGAHIARVSVQEFTSGNSIMSQVYLQACVDLHLRGASACSSQLADIRRRTSLVEQHFEVLNKVPLETGARWRVLDSIFNLNLDLSAWKAERDRLDGSIGSLRSVFSRAIETLVRDRKGGIDALSSLNSRAPGFGDAELILQEAVAKDAKETPQLDALERMGPRSFVEQKLRRYRSPTQPTDYWLVDDGVSELLR